MQHNAFGVGVDEALRPLVVGVGAHSGRNLVTPAQPQRGEVAVQPLQGLIGLSVGKDRIRLTTIERFAI